MRHSDYDKHIDALTLAVVSAVDGEDLYDAALASAAVMTMSLNAMDEPTRAKAKAQLAAFMADLETKAATA